MEFVDPAEEGPGIPPSIGKKNNSLETRQVEAPTGTYVRTVYVLIERNSSQPKPPGSNGRVLQTKGQICIVTNRRCPHLRLNYLLMASP
jgi:hypothetical protein